LFIPVFKCMKTFRRRRAQSAQRSHFALRALRCSPWLFIPMRTPVLSRAGDRYVVVCERGRERALQLAHGFVVIGKSLQFAAPRRGKRVLTVEHEEVGRLTRVEFASLAGVLQFGVDTGILCGFDSASGRLDRLKRVANFDFDQLLGALALRVNLFALGERAAQARLRSTVSE